MPSLFRGWGGSKVVHATVLAPDLFFLLVHTSCLLCPLPCTWICQVRHLEAVPVYLCSFILLFSCLYFCSCLHLLSQAGRLVLLLAHLASSGTSQVAEVTSQVTEARSLATSCCLALYLMSVLGREAVGWGNELGLGSGGQATQGL